MARARNAHDPVIGRSPSPYIRFPPLAARARNAHDPVIGRSPSPYIRFPPLAARARNAHDPVNFKTSFLRNQNESEAENGGPDVSGHGEFFQIHLIFYI